MIIEIHPKGKSSQIFGDLLNDFIVKKHEIKVTKYQYKNLGAIETIMITVIGTVVSNILTDIIKHIISKARKDGYFNEDKRINIYIEETKKVYELPTDEALIINDLSKPDDGKRA